MHIPFQLNPVQNGVLDVLEEVYREWWDVFRFDTFHLGADEIDLRCYNSSSELTDYMEERGIPRTQDGFLGMVVLYMNGTIKALKRAVPAGTDVDYVVWNSHLTNERYVHNLDPANYTIQIWTGQREGEVLEKLAFERSLLCFILISQHENNCFFSFSSRVSTLKVWRRRGTS